MNEPIAPPLAHLAGARPPAPAWFEEAIADPPEERRVTVEGAGIELLVWGAEGAPGLLLCHGGMAHAGWWRPIAPLFADRFRVAALSWSGMGGSDWRPAYSIDLYVEEVLACVKAAGLAAAGPPVIVGHSFGAAPVVVAAHRHGSGLGGAIVLDSGVGPPDPRHYARRAMPGGRAYPSVEAALGRFRLMPEQPVANLFIVDLIARGAIRQTAEGWSWCFDPAFVTRMQPWDSWSAFAQPRCPLAVVHGDRSRIVSPDLLARQRAQAPPGTPFVRLAHAHHHLMVDQPLALVAAIDALLAGHFAPGNLNRLGACDLPAACQTGSARA